MYCLSKQKGTFTTTYIRNMLAESSTKSYVRRKVCIWREHSPILDGSYPVVSYHDGPALPAIRSLTDIGHVLHITHRAAKPDG